MATLAVNASSGAPALGQSIVSSFNTDAEGWTADGNGGGAIVYAPTGGNPGGAVSITDVDNGYAYFRAPASFLPFGAYGGTIGFDLMTVATGPDPVQHPTQIALEGNGMTLINGSLNPLNVFIRFDFDFVETDGWQIYPDRNNVYAPGATATPTQAQMQAVLSNLTGVLISADYTNGLTTTGTTETTTIDMVVMTVPEPATVFILAFGGTLLALRRRERRA